jgi:hypothetical protein
MMIQVLQVLATEVQVGDTVSCSEVDYIVRMTRRVNHAGIPQAIRDVGGWVDLTGDSADKYFTNIYGGEESYYAYPTEMIQVKREVSE